MDLEYWHQLIVVRDSRFKWLNEVPLMLGPVVGHTTDTTAKIWIRATKHEERLVLRYAPANGAPRYNPDAGGFTPVAIAEPIRELPIQIQGGPYPVASTRLDGLDPDTRYFYEIARESAERSDSDFVISQPPSFRTLPSDDDPALCADVRFAFMSCNGVHKRPDGFKATAMWMRMLETVLGDPKIRFAVYGGDQIYADHIRDQWLSVNSRTGTMSDHDKQALLTYLRTEYGRVYAAWWRRPEIRAFMAHVPGVMTWDDHDIYDGYGSHGDEDFDAQRVFFDAASEAFDAHQMIHNPSLTNGRQYGHDHRAFHFRVGTTGFLVLDLRSCRRLNTSSVSTVLGDQQWSYIDIALAEFARAGITSLVVVSSVPPVYISDFAASMPRWMSFSLHDDLVDQWSSPSNKNDQQRLFGTMFEFRHDTGCNVMFVGGDIHVGAAGRITSERPEFLLPGERVATLHQGSSSAIGHAPPTGIGAGLIQHNVEGKHRISEAFTGFIEETYFTRNFAVVAAVTRRSKRAFRFKLYLETQRSPIEHYFPGPRPQR